MTKLILPDSLPLEPPKRLLTRATSWTGEVEWYTPDHILELACEVLGEIDLDPASSDAAHALASVKARQYFTMGDDTLNRPWRGRVFLNPPYAGKWIEAFTVKMVRSYNSGEMTAGIMLANSSTETVWWQMAFDACDAICFHTRRIKFVKGAGIAEDKKRPTHPNTLFYFGPDAAQFKRVFGRIGKVCKP